VSKGSRINGNFCGFLERAMGIEPTSEAWVSAVRIGQPMRRRLCPVLCPPPNPTECYRLSVFGA
jgi:hypothetical protein